MFLHVRSLFSEDRSEALCQKGKTKGTRKITLHPSGGPKRSTDRTPGKVQNTTTPYMGKMERRVKGIHRGRGERTSEQ